jgi:ketosteroid isomerase-like protein
MMHRCIVTALFLLCATGSAISQNPGAEVPKPPTPLEQTLLSNNKAVSEAYKNKDIDFLKRTVTDDFVAIGTGGKPSGKADLIENMRETKIDDYRPYEAKVVSLTDDAAIVTYDCVVRMQVYDEVVPRYQRISDVWVKQGDQWRLKFQQATPQ